ncbi:uncharacterized protein LOC134282380 [Saccostrea cucullata]|uniref:uncharacterized protein LOC134282380 n=1 Tax=Saccostrea cuccullata TaxID=36930 RepID=UPI002ED4A8AD
MILSVGINETVNLYGRYVRFNLVENSDGVKSDDRQNSESSQGKAQSAFDDLMMAHRKMILTKPYSEDTKISNNTRVLFNKILCMIQKAGSSLTHSSLESGTTLIHTLTDCLWYIDPFSHRMEERHCNLPLIFEHLAGFNNQARHKHKKEDIRYPALQSHVAKLELALESTFLNGPLWYSIKKALCELSEMCNKYCIYLKDDA